MPRTASILLMLLLAFGHCPANEGIEFFEKEIRPILVERCYKCHSAEHKIKGGLNLDSRAGLQQGGDSGAVVVAKDAGASLLIEAVRYHNRDLQMPPKNRLPDQEIRLLEKWVNLGAPDPREGSATIDAGGMSLEEGKKFWSFRPLASVSPPETDPSPVDAFIRKKLEEENLSFAPPADRRTLIRRITQNLTGLPPTTEEVAAFVADTSSDAFSKLVDRLLDSPHYGVRWGRHWLDVARYSDSNGLDENLGFGQAWRYRDYVVASFNEDKPYDRFLIEQLAGDLLSDADTESITGTGFLQLGPKVLAEPNLEKMKMDIIDEQLDTLGKAFLGMTFGCVRCHDHKFDPVTQADYYSLAAIFKGTKTIHDRDRGIKKWVEYSLATEEEAARFKELEKEIAAKKKVATDFKSKEVVKLRTEARSKAVEYLVAAKRFDTTAPLSVVEEIAAPENLHPRILHHCRMHLSFHREDPFFAVWHDGNEQQIRDHYGPLFEKAEKIKKGDPKNPQLETAKAVLYNNSGFLAVPTVEAFAFDKETLAEYHRLLDQQRAFEISAPDEPSLMSVCEGDEVVAEIPIHIRGSYQNLGEKVSRSVPAVMRWSNEPPAFSPESSGRLELARWMTDSRHPLTARVIVNRVWAWHFGTGLVKTTENFGVMGDRPSHPELLDWLTGYFVENGWSLKKLHRLILNSRTWQQSASHPEFASYSLIDPENRFLWRANIRRLEAEQIRDSILSVADRLDTEFGGKTLPLRNRQFVFNHTSQDHTKYHSLRRAIYLPVIRNNLYPMFEQFDYPDPTMPTGVRNETVIAPQALVLMNDGLIMDSAEALAYKVTTSYQENKGRIRHLYEEAFGRPPTKEETSRIEDFVKSAPEDKAWPLVCQSLLVSNEFIYLR